MTLTEVLSTMKHGELFQLSSSYIGNCPARCLGDVLTWVASGQQVEARNYTADGWIRVIREAGAPQLKLEDVKLGSVVRQRSWGRGRESVFVRAGSDGGLYLYNVGCSINAEGLGCMECSYRASEELMCADDWEYDNAVMRKEG